MSNAIFMVSMRWAHKFFQIFNLGYFLNTLVYLSTLAVFRFDFLKCSLRNSCKYTFFNSLQITMTLMSRCNDADFVFAEKQKYIVIEVLSITEILKFLS